MVYIKIDTGSHAKGYAVEGSDRDYVVFRRSDEDAFLDHIADNKKRLVNVHGKDDEGNDCVYMDLYMGLMGIYTGKYYKLGVFSEREHFVDKNGIENTALFEFVRQLTRERMTNILKTMIRLRPGKSDAKESFQSCPKYLLSLMYNLAYINFWLKHKTFPKANRLPQLLERRTDSVLVYERLMELRRWNATCSPAEAKKASEPDRSALELWQKELAAKLDMLEPLPELYDLKKVMVMYMLNLGDLVMPKRSSIFDCTFPAIQQLTRTKNGMLFGRTVTVQEKLHGVNFRIIYHRDDVTFGSRNTYRHKSDFKNYHKIRPQLELCTRSLHKLLNLDSFVVYGELMGWCKCPIEKCSNTGAGDTKCWLGNDVRYYAYEIRRYDGHKNEFIDFVEAQRLLKKSAFLTIPFEYKLYDDFIADIRYRSILFNHNQEEYVEGYIVRCDKLRYKVKRAYALKGINDKSTLIACLTAEFVDEVLGDEPIRRRSDLGEFVGNAKRCYDALMPLKEQVSTLQVYGKLFGLLCQRHGVKHDQFAKTFEMFTALMNRDTTVYKCLFNP